MKTQSSSTPIPFRVLLCGLLVSLCLIAGCNNSSKENGGNNSDDGKSGKNEENKNGKGNETKQAVSLNPRQVLGTIPEFQLTDQDGNEFGSKDLKNHLWVASFIFTSCKSTCPVQTQNMYSLQERLKLASTDPVTLDGVRLISFSVDPETDTPEVLKRYAESNDADQKMWKFLTGDREKIWELCKKGFMLPVAENKDDTEMPISHSPRFVVVDRMMQIRGFLEINGSEDLNAINRFIDAINAEFQPPESYQSPFEGDEKVTHIAQPPEILTDHWLDEKREKQLATKESIQANVDFRFEDQRAASGIDYDPQIVDEQRWRLEVNHYDHGNSVSIADVDGDGKLDLYFTSQASRNELWKNLGGGKFKNITVESGTGLDDRVCVAASFADIDNDGDADLFVSSVRGGNSLLLNDGSGKFSDATEGSGLAYSGHSSGSLFFDYDRDGLLDLFVTNVGKYTSDDFEPVRHDSTSSLPADKDISYYLGVKNAFFGHLNPKQAEKSLLYHNEGNGKFKEVTSEMGCDDLGWSGDATAMDGNGDGWPDLYVLNMQGHDQYFENQQGKKFVNKNGERFAKTPWGAMGVKAFDFDNDLNIDLFLTDMHSDMSENIGPAREKLKSRMRFPEEKLLSKGKSIFGNAFYKGDGKGGFAEVSDQIGAENYWPWGLTVGDLNADGFQDAFVASSMCFPYRYAVNSVLINEKGKMFRDAEFIVGVEPRTATESIKPWFVLDADGADSSNKLCMNRSGKVVVWSAVGSRSSAVFDLDDDGDLDIVTNEFNSPPMVLISNLSEKTDLNYLKIRLVGSKSNRDGLGAKVTITTAAGKQMRVYDGQSGYISHSLYPLYFGLGKEKQVTSIEITWPNGETVTKEGPFDSNQQLTFEEGK